MQKPLVTVILSAYNHEEYVEECLKSIVEQTYSNLQILVYNDGSKDNTGKVIEDFIKNQDKKIEYISKDNEGLCKTLNKGLDRAEGQYIAIIASDDIWLPNKIEEQVNFLENNQNIGLVFSDAYFIRGNARTEEKYTQYKKGLSRHFEHSVQKRNLYEALLVENFVIAITVMVRKECFERVGQFDGSLKFEDYDMWLRISKNYPFGFLDKPLAYYRMHETNVSNDAFFMLKGALQAIKKQYKENPLKKRYIKKTILFSRFLFTVLKNRVRRVFKQ